MTVPTGQDEAVPRESPRAEGAGLPRRGRFPALTRLRERIRSNAVLNTTWRVGIFVVGWLIVIAGLVMLVVPGPGIAAVVVGFAILATEFVWARHLLRRARRAAVRARERALDPRVRRRNQILLSIGAVVAAVAVAAYLWRFGFTLPWEALRQLGVL